MKQRDLILTTSAGQSLHLHPYGRNMVRLRSKSLYDMFNLIQNQECIVELNVHTGRLIEELAVIEKDKVRR